MIRSIALSAALAALMAPGQAAEPALPALLSAQGETLVLRVHAEGAQVYQCESDSSGKLKWAFREPIATLLRDGKTVGRHYAGPRWELDDGSVVQGKVVAKVEGATPADVAWLKLAAMAHAGQGGLAEVTTIQRIETHGGALAGECDTAGAFRSVPYSAEYLFSKK